jgi:hypothetical protein
MMVGSFGLNTCHLPRISRDCFVEANPRIDAFELHRCGALVDGAATELRWGDHGGCQLAARTPNLWIGEISVLVVWDEPMESCGRPWFECPLCKQRARHLYLRKPIACRRCHGLRYLAENRQQTLGVGRVQRLRRKLGGCDTRPFAPLPARRPGRSRACHERLVVMICAEESKLVEHLQTVTRDLERRIAVRKLKHQW